MASTNTQPIYITQRDVCANVPGLSLSTVRHWCACGRLPTVKIGRQPLIRRDEAARFLKLDPSELITASAK